MASYTQELFGVARHKLFGNPLATWNRYVNNAIMLLIIVLKYTFFNFF
jgi:hypothetical protein